MMNENEMRQRFSLLSEESLQQRPSCPDTERLAAYVEGRLGNRERESMESHLTDCGYCLGQVRFLLRSEDLGPAHEVPQRLIEVVREGERRPAWRHAPAWLAAAAGLVLVVMTVRFGLIGSPPEGPFGSGAETEAVETGDESRSVRNHLIEAAVPSIVHPLDGQRLGRDALTIAWEPVPEAFDYSVQLMDTEGNLVWEDRTGAQSTTVPLEITLEPGQRYFVWVAAHLRSGLRAKSPAVAFEMELE